MSAVASGNYVLGPFAGAEAPAAVPGLSKSHNRPQGSITFLRGASFAKIVTPSPFMAERRSTGSKKRAEILSFSQRSRQRLRIKIASVCRSELPLFCTLTYPAEWIWDAKLWKRHLKMFSQRFLRRWKTAGFVWKLEFQKRGAPHFHPFIWGIPEEQHHNFLDWISNTWNEVAGGRDAAHLAAGTRVERMRSVGAATRYVSGYASKTDQTLPGQNVGRYWGIVGKTHIPWGHAETINLNKSQSKFVLRTCRRYILSVNRQTRIKIVAKQIKLSPSQLVSLGGWFTREAWQRPLGKRLRAAGSRMPQKLRLRNLRSMNVFLDADFWAEKLREATKLPGAPRPQEYFLLPTGS